MNSTLRLMIRAVLEESSAARRAQARAITGDRNTKLEIWQLADSLITTPPSAHFTMTSIQKVGINPGSRYNTPLAIYAYPVTDHTVDQLMGVFQPDVEAHNATGATPAELKKIAANKAKSAESDEEQAQFFAQFPLSEVYHKLPFVADAPYINFFSLQPDGVFYTSIGMTQGQYDAGIANLTAYVKQNDVGTDKRYGTPEEAMQQIVDRAMSFHKIVGGMDDVGRLKVAWTTTRGWAQRLADQVQRGDVEGMSPRSLVMWRRLLLEMGIKAVCDDAGLSLVHPAEPIQTAVMDTTIVEIIRQFDNRTPTMAIGGRERSERQKTDYEVQSGNPTGMIKAALKDENTVPIDTPRAKAALQAMQAAADSGENVFVKYLSAMGSGGSISFGKFAHIERKTGKRFRFLDALFRDMNSELINYFGQRNIIIDFTFSDLLRRGVDRQADQDLVANYLINLMKFLENQYRVDSSYSAGRLQYHLYRFLGLDYKRSESDPNLEFLESRQDVLDAFKSLMSTLSTITKFSGELMHNIRMMASGAAPHLYPAFRKIFVEDGWPAGQIEIDGYDYAAQQNYIINQATAFEDVEQARKVTAEKRAEKEKAVAAYWAAPTPNADEEEAEVWNRPKTAALKSIYKDPKFLNKTGKSRYYSSYSDEDDG